MPEQSLKQKTIRGTAWSFIDSIANQGVTFLIGLVLARLLSPEEYGLIGIILVFIAVFNCIVDSGFSNALIWKIDVADIDYNTVFIFNMVLSVTLFVLMFYSSSAIAIFFNQPLLEPLTKAMASIVIINAFAIIQRTILVKRIDFKTQTKISLISSICSGAIGIGMAIAKMGVWSLVGQQISRQLLNSILLWIYVKWRPKWRFSFQSFGDLFGFGWKLMVSSLIDTVWREIYQVIIGKFYSATTLGQYTRVHQFSSIASSNLTMVVQRVSYPVLSSIQDDKIRLKSAYKRVIKVTMFVTFTLMLGMSASAKSMIQVLIGDQWLPCVPFLQIICLSMMLYPLHALNLNMLQVQGRSDLFLRLEIIKKCIGIVPLLLGVFVDIYWMLCGSVFTGIISYYLNAYYSGPYLDYSIREQVKDILPGLSIAVAMFGIVYIMSFLPINPFILFPMQLIIGLAIVIGLCERQKIEEYQEIRRIINSYILKIENR